MNSKILGLLSFSIAAIPSFLPAQSAGPKSDLIHLSTTQGHPAPVVLELFTSQGCSSCPPAEMLLNTWGQDQFKNGKIIPLAFHVDYWDYLGWADPFSSADYTGRQKAYAPLFDMNSLYTPQAVLGGQSQAVGSDANSLQARVKSLSTVLSTSGLSLTARRRGGYLDLEIKTTGSGIPGSDWTLSLAVFENGLVNRRSPGRERRTDFEREFCGSILQPALPGAGHPNSIHSLGSRLERRPYRRGGLFTRPPIDARRFFGGNLPGAVRAA